ncbi:MAG TPA: 5'-3' exonuclease [Mycobacteriales bacterium]
MLLDGASMWFRAFYGVPASVTAPDGTPVNAVRGFLDHVARLITTHRPRQLVCCLDHDWRPQFRVDALPSYKAHRVVEGNDTDTPDELAPQVEVILAVLDAVGICVAGSSGFEADDVIGTLAAQAQSDVLVVTGDRDLFQLIDQRTRVVYTVTKDAVLDEDFVRRKYGLPSAAAYADFALLRGDPSDGLPGVPGVGEKTAAALITKYGSIDGLLAALDGGADVTGGAKVAAARAYVEAAGPVVRVVRDCPLPPLKAALPASPDDPDGLVALADRWGIRSSASRLVTALTSATTG